MSPSENDTRDRVIRLEARFEEMSRAVGKMDGKVSEMHEVLTKAKGARWAFVVLWVAVGAAVGKVAMFLQWLGGHNGG